MMWQSIINRINPYFYIVCLRNWFYDLRLFKAKRVPIPVVSIGNLSVGGTGKTSVVRYLAEKLSSDTELLVLSRGYKRKSKGFRWVLKEGELLADISEAGDEPYMLAKLFEGNTKVSVAVCESRYKGAVLALKEISPKVIILDDGFQHRAIHRDLDLVLVAEKDLSDLLLPFGRLREPKSSLKRAHGIILSYQELSPFQFFLQNKPVFKMYRKNFRLLNSSLKAIDFSKDLEFIAFSALGDNAQFFSVLERLGVNIKRRLSLPDHFDYRGFRIDPNERYVTTLKDFFKVNQAHNIFVVDFEVEVPGLEEFVRNVIFKKPCSVCGESHPELKNKRGEG